MNDELSLAVEERKIIQDIIHNKESIRMKIVGWCMTIIIGFTIAFHADEIEIGGWKYAVFSIAVVLAFFLLDTVNRGVFYKMLKRSEAVEKMIREDAEKYDGFRIEESMLESLEWCKILKKDWRLLAPYFVLLAMVFVSLIV